MHSTVLCAVSQRKNNLLGLNLFFGALSAHSNPRRDPTAARSVQIPPQRLFSQQQHWRPDHDYAQPTPHAYLYCESRAFQDGEERDISEVLCAVKNGTFVPRREGEQLSGRGSMCLRTWMLLDCRLSIRCCTCMRRGEMMLPQAMKRSCSVRGRGLRQRGIP